MVTAAGLVERELGYAAVYIQMQNGRGDHVVLGCDPECPVPIVLGTPWLAQQRAILDFAEGRLITKLGTFFWSPTDPVHKRMALYVGLDQEEGTGVQGVLEWENLAEGLLTGEERKTVKEITDTAQVTPGGKEKLRQLLVTYRGAWCGPAVGCARGPPHVIELKSTRPVVCRPRAVPQKWQQPLENHITELINLGAIEPSSSDSAANPVCVGKPDGSLRLCIDYRRLNDNTVPDKHPLPLIQDLLQMTAGSNYFILARFTCRILANPVKPKLETLDGVPNGDEDYISGRYCLLD